MIDRARLEEIVREAGRIAYGAWPGAGHALESWEKTPGSPVCEVDLDVDRMLRARLEGLLPDAGWLSEETVVMFSAQPVGSARERRLAREEVRQVAETGATLIVSPDCNPSVIAETRARGLVSFPGVMTPTECFTALRAGADGLKIFPGAVIGPEGLRAIRAVLPPETPCFAVGGTGPETFAAWHAAGATGLGIGSALYRPGDDAATVATRAAAIVAHYDEVCRG